MERHVNFLVCYQNSLAKVFHVFSTCFRPMTPPGGATHVHVYLNHCALKTKITSIVALLDKVLIA